MAAAKSDQRLQALEAQLAKQATQISEAWQHISTEEAADEAIHEHFAASLDGPRPKTGDSRPSSVQEDRTPPVHTAEEHAKVEEALAQSVHMLSMERIALHNTPSAHVPPPTIAEAPEAGDEASADAEGAAEPPPAPASGGGHAELVQDMSSVKVSRKLKDRLQFEMLSSDVAALADDLAARTRAMEAQMATVRSEIMAGLQTPPPTPPPTPPRRSGRIMPVCVLVCVIATRSTSYVNCRNAKLACACPAACAASRASCVSGASAR